MAAEVVMWAKLETMLAHTEEPERLVDLVKKAQGLVGVLEGRDKIHHTCDDTADIHLRSDNDNISDVVMRGLLKELSTLLYKADDLLDEILTFNQCPRLYRGRRENRVSAFFIASNKYSYRKVMARRVKKIAEELKNVVDRSLDVPNSSTRSDLRDSRRIESVQPDHGRLLGRRDDKIKIEKLLGLPHSCGEEPMVSVVCMTGLAGVGKSALAKDVYDDQKIKSHFDLRLWISVSGITDEKEIIRCIVKSCTRRSNHQNSTVCDVDPRGRNTFRDLLGCRTTSTSKNSIIKVTCHDKNDRCERQLRNEIGGKHYLLVLDDVCLKEWKCLRDLFAEGARGSRILMTTRSDEVARIVKQEFSDSEPYSLKGPPENFSWLLFKQQASKEEKFWDKEVMEAADEIVDICQSVPLSIKIAARFLHDKRRDEWFTFTEGLRLRRSAGENIMDHVLYRMYTDLSPHVRACFVYCSLFPDDFVFNKCDLISLWIAQGFVEHQDHMSSERVAEMYFMELSRRWLFEDVRTDDLGNILTCKMHHIVHSFATEFAAGISNLQLTDSGMIQIKDPTTKHVSVFCRSGSSLKPTPAKLKSPSLRTLIFVKEHDCDIEVDSSISDQLISTYRSLRVLDLHDLGMNELPESIGDQIHLRYLDISKNDGLITLPKSFSRLYNLQKLKLNSCPQLTQIDIDFGQLVSLRHFEVDDCERLTCMPIGLEKLTELETLTRFVVGERSSKEPAPVRLQALSKLNKLRGRLAIQFTGDWKTRVPEVSEVLYKKENLVEVKIIWAQRTSDDEGPSKEEISAHVKTLEDLKPNEALKSLHIEGYKGCDFPSWANQQITFHLPNLVTISIDGCSKCEYLPPFSELKHLEKLTLRNMTNVKFIEGTALAEVQVRSSQEPEQKHTFFESLKELSLHNFYELLGWHQDVASIEQAKPRSFPCLFKLRIWNSPNLISFPSFVGVSEIDLRNVNHSLFTESKKTGNTPKGKLCTSKLRIKGCVGLKDFRVVREGLQGLPLLTELVISSCDELISLASDIPQLTSLKKLVISNCKVLDLSQDSGTQRTLRQQAARRLACLQGSPWMNLKSLRELKLREIKKMETLPDGLQHLKSLKTMCISACPSLGSLPEWISKLTELRHLRIESCRALKSLPEGLKDVKSLMKVEITECPELMQRCREHTGKDWSKIKHARVLLHKSRRYGHV